MKAERAGPQSENRFAAEAGRDQLCAVGVASKTGQGFTSGSKQARCRHGEDIELRVR